MTDKHGPIRKTLETSQISNAHLRQMDQDQEKIF